MNLFSLFIVAGMILWLVKPLRVVVVQRTNRTVKALLVAFPVSYAGTLTYRFFWGNRDDSVIVGFTVLALLIAWVALIVVGNVLGRKAAAPPTAAPFGPGMHVPGMPARMGELGAARAANAALAQASADRAPAPPTLASGRDRQATGESVLPGTVTAVARALAPPAIRAIRRKNETAGEIAEAAAPNLIEVGIPIAVRVAEVAAPAAVRIAQVAAPAAIRAAQEVAPAAIQKVKAAARGDASIDTSTAAMTVGRVAGTWFAKARKSFAEGASAPPPR